MSPSNSWGEWLIDYPRDILFILDQVAAKTIPGLEGVIDAERAGALGYSFDGYDALSLSGARVDPEFYLARCADPARDGPAPENWWVKYICAPAKEWDNFTANAGEAITTSEDGLWQPMTDERIRAVMPMAPEGAWLFGQRGLAAVNRPALIIGATNDSLNYYDLEAVFIYEQLGTPDRFLISFIGEGHMMIFNARQSEKMAHFATAFFGTYLQGRGDLKPYFQEAFVAQDDELAWGVYEAD